MVIYCFCEVNILNQNLILQRCYADRKPERTFFTETTRVGPMESDQPALVRLERNRAAGDALEDNALNQVTVSTKATILFPRALP